MNPHQITKDFEKAVAEYAGAPYCVAVNSCTNALFLCLMWYRYRVGGNLAFLPPCIEIPKRTYVSVPMQIMHAGFEVEFREENWLGYYKLRPLAIWDCARFFSSDMYRQMGGFVCTSHHWSKTLGLQQAGCILHSDERADEWFRRARFDGRREGVSPKDDDFSFCGWHFYLSPEISALGLVKLAFLPKHNDPLPNDDYPDLSKLTIFGATEAKRIAEPAEWR